MLETDHLLQNRYRIVKVLGRGGFGAVYEAREVTLKYPCVIKEMLPPADASFIKPLADQFLREVTVLATIRHPNLPRVSHYFVENDSYYLVMDLVEGQSLDKLIGPNGLPEAVVLDYAKQLLTVLEYIHDKRIIHRDIKPANIIVQPDGRVVLVDFGLVKNFSSTSGGVSMRALSPYYAPPEQYTGGTDARSDLYSLAATLYQALTARLPESATDQITGTPLTPVRQYSPGVSPNTAKVIEKALTLKPQGRYQTASEMRVALSSVSTPPARNVQPGLDPAKTRQLEDTQSPHTSPPGSHLPRTAVAAVGVISVIALLILGVALLPGMAPASPEPTQVASVSTRLPVLTPKIDPTITPLLPAIEPTWTSSPIPPTPIKPTVTLAPPTQTPTTQPSVEPTITSTPLPQPTKTSTPDDLCNPPWFFRPHGTECLLKYRSEQAAMRSYEQGMLLWLNDTELSNQVFVFYRNGNWDNPTGSLDSIGAALSAQLGQLVGGQRSFMACAGHTDMSGVVTAYVSDADRNILSWSISTQSLSHLAWRYLSNASYIGC